MKLLTSLVFVLAICMMGFTMQNTNAQIAGGFESVSKTDPQVRAAAKFAVAAECKRTKRNITLVSIDSAAQQVVAGMNYKVCMQVRDGRHVRNATAVVWRNLQGGRSLRSWDWGACE